MVLSFSRNDTTIKCGSTKRKVDGTKTYRGTITVYENNDKLWSKIIEIDRLDQQSAHIDAQFEAQALLRNV